MLDKNYFYLINLFYDLESIKPFDLTSDFLNGPDII